MIYNQLFAKFDRTVRVGVIGTGHYATALITQSLVVDRLEVPVVCDVNPDAAQRAYDHAGLDSDNTVICETTEQAAKAMEDGKHVILTDAMAMMDLPLDVIVESTGVPAAGAKHGLEAIKHGKHVAMVSKETDVLVGPILKYKADQAGLVYTAVDGDQHGLLIALVRWARDLGLEVLSGGKSLEFDHVYDPDTNAISWSTGNLQIPDEHRDIFNPKKPENASQYVAARREVLGELGVIAGYDITEMTISANATGLRPDVDTLHYPVVSIPEIPQVLAPKEDGGILSHRGVIDCVSCLRRPYEAGMGGGVFIVVSCENDYSRYILTSKGLISNKKETTALIYRPYHLCGVETPITALVAGLLNLPTGATDYHPSYDVVARVKETLKAGDEIGTDHSKNVEYLMRPSSALAPNNPIPFHMASGNTLATDVPEGEIITASAIKEPSDTTLWDLRREQDAHFLGK
ncbi:MAG: putative homoserine dehydrogenase-like protein [Candidatus Latescibacterota bacterium]|jgi:predicted homoserine dehydrogenase-like protein